MPNYSTGFLAKNQSTLDNGLPPNTVTDKQSDR